MTADHIVARNRINAQKSTGPKSATGKATVAGNAYRHGATAKPDAESVAAWLAIILNRPEITPDDLLPRDEAGARALLLAEAEVRLINAISAEQSASRDASAPGTFGAAVHELLQDYPHPITGELAQTVRLVLRMDRSDRKRKVNRLRLTRRYRREAQAQRRRVFEAWAAARTRHAPATLPAPERYGIPKQSQIST